MGSRLRRGQDNKLYGKKNINPLVEHFYEMYVLALEEAKVILERYPGIATGEQTMDEMAMNPMWIGSGMTSKSWKITT